MTEPTDPTIRQILDEAAREYPVLDPDDVVEETRTLAPHVVEDLEGWLSSLLAGEHETEPLPYPVPVAFALIREGLQSVRTLLDRSGLDSTLVIPRHSTRWGSSSLPTETLDICRLIADTLTTLHPSGHEPDALDLIVWTLHSRKLRRDAHVERHGITPERVVNPDVDLGPLAETSRLDELVSGLPETDTSESHFFRYRRADIFRHLLAGRLGTLDLPTDTLAAGLEVISTADRLAASTEDRETLIAVEHRLSVMLTRGASLSLAERLELPEPDENP